MQIAVMGAGAIGCYYGGLLARSGLPVTLIGRRPHVEAVASAACCWTSAASRPPFR